eukprot:1541053-Amphidinium_carterae.1
MSCNTSQVTDYPSQDHETDPRTSFVRLSVRSLSRASRPYPCLSNEFHHAVPLAARPRRHPVHAHSETLADKVFTLYTARRGFRSKPWDPRTF